MNTYRYYPSLKIYHPNSRGMGSALMFKLIPFVNGDPDSGALFVYITPQVGNRYIWLDDHCVRLNFEDVARMLMVFRGETESINDGAGIIRSDCRFIMSHVIEPVCGYRMTLIRDNSITDFMLKPTEALGISLALEHSMAKLVFEMEG